MAVWLKRDVGINVGEMSRQKERIEKKKLEIDIQRRASRGGMEEQRWRKREKEEEKREERGDGKKCLPCQIRRSGRAKMRRKSDGMEEKFDLLKRQGRGRARS